MVKKSLKNRKGFTLVEIIVVLVIMGILLAIAVPSIMGYVGQARDQQYLAEGRNGYLAAQTIVARELAGNNAVDADAGAAALAKITTTRVAEELGEAATSATVTAITCELATSNTAIAGCSVKTKNGGADRWMNYTAATETSAPIAEVADAPIHPVVP